MPRAPLPADAVISPGDVIAITVVGEPELSRRVTVTDDGKVPIAFVGEVKVAGLKPAQAADAIRQALSRYLLKPEVAVDLVEANRASVFGRVLRPGTYVLPPRARAMDLIQMAGGFEATADRQFRCAATIAVDLAALRLRQRRTNLGAKAGDVLSVPSARCSCCRSGQVLRPGTLASRWVPGDGRHSDGRRLHGARQSERVVARNGDPGEPGADQPTAVADRTRR